MLENITGSVIVYGKFSFIIAFEYKQKRQKQTLNIINRAIETSNVYVLHVNKEYLLANL